MLKLKVLFHINKLIMNKLKHHILRYDTREAACKKSGYMSDVGVSENRDINFMDVTVFLFMRLLL